MKRYEQNRINNVKINEIQLRNIITESVKKVLNEKQDALQIEMQEASQLKPNFVSAILFKLRELEDYWWQKHKSPYPYSRDVLQQALEWYDSDHREGGEGLEYCGYER